MAAVPVHGDRDRARLLMSVFININRFSLHAMYRNRLIRAYLGASRVHTERDQTFNPFTGFDNLDNPP